MKRDKEVLNAALYGFMAGIAFSGVLRAVSMMAKNKKHAAVDSHSGESCCNHYEGCCCGGYDWEEEAKDLE